MPDEEFDAFCADIGKRGQRAPIVLFEGKVLDGWHRYRACLRLGITPKTENYSGDDPSGLVISLNVLRRKLGAMQRALAGAQLNLKYSVTQEDASKRVGVSKVHINLVVQAINSRSARVLKMLENPDLTRERLHEELIESGIVRTPTSPVAASAVAQPKLSSAAATVGLDALFRNRDTDADDLLGDGASGDEVGDDDLEALDGVLAEPPSAGGKVLSFTKSTTDSGMPVAGTKPSHPERRTRDTPASLLADRFKGLGEADQVSFMQLTWHLQRKLLKVAGLSVDADTPPRVGPTSTAPTGGTTGKPSKATSAQAKAAAALAASAAITSAKAGAVAPAKPAGKARGAKVAAKAA